MSSNFEGFFDSSFLPHGYCLQWRPDILWTHVASDLLIAAAYFSIPIAILIFTRKRKDLEFRGVFVLFALFILLCGLTHLTSIYTMWEGSYGFHAVVKACTAVVSMLTAYVVFRDLDKAVAIPSREDLEKAIQETANERLRATRLEVERRAEAIFKFTTDLIPTGVLVVDKDQNIVLTNSMLNKIFHYDADELMGKPLSTLIDPDNVHHHALVQGYMQHPEQQHRMASGRMVRGRRKDGEPVDIQISLDVHEYESERHAFATVTDVGSFVLEQYQFSDLNNRLKRAVDGSNDGIWEWNVQNDEVWYSPQFMRLIGRADETEPKFVHWEEHVHPEDKQFVERTIKRHLEHNEKYDISYRGMSESGNYEWFHTRGSTMKDSEGKPLLMSGTLSNINATRELESELEQQQSFLDQVLKRSLAAMYFYDLSTQRNTFVNPEYTQLTGYTLEDLERKEQWELFHPEDRVRVQQHLSDIANHTKDQGHGIEYRFRHKDGSWRWFYSRDAVYSYDEQGGSERILGSFFDITELKQRENEIRQMAVEFAATFEQAGVGIAHVSQDGSFIKVNSRLGQILGRSREGLSHFNLREIVVSEDRKEFLLAFESLSKKQTHEFEQELRCMHSDGRHLWVHINVSRVQSAPDETFYYIAIVEDISERKAMENRLSESNTALERFAYSASHDLQEPLRKISAFSGILERKLAGTAQDEETHQLLHRMSEAALRMSEMVDNLLQLSRATRAPLTLTQCSLSSLLVQAIFDLSERLSSRDIQVILAKDCNLNVDLNAMGQVLRNLLNNSFNYRDQSRALKVELDCLTEGNELLIIYKDNGTGFPPEKSEQIFEPFKRLVGRDIPGTGMGLAICRQILQAHGGQMLAQSGKPHGAVFYLRLPISTGD